MRLPFSQQQFFDLFADYNRAVWPAPLIAYVLGLTLVALALRRSAFLPGITWTVLAIFWLFNGVAYHLLFFSTINRAGNLFGFLFIWQGLLFLYLGWKKTNLVFDNQSRASIIAAGALIGYAMVLYPILTVLSGHAYPAAPAFGVAPCPTTIFTFGMLLLTDGRIPRVALVVPVLWSLVSLSAAVQLSVYADFALPISAIVATTMVLHKRRPTVGSSPAGCISPRKGIQT